MTTKKLAKHKLDHRCPRLVRYNTQRLPPSWPSLILIVYYIKVFNYVYPSKAEAGAEAGPVSYCGSSLPGPTPPTINLPHANIPSLELVIPTTPTISLLHAYLPSLEWIIPTWAFFTYHQPTTCLPTFLSAGHAYLGLLHLLSTYNMPSYLP